MLIKETTQRSEITVGEPHPNLALTVENEHDTQIWLHVGIKAPQPSQTENITMDLAFPCAAFVDGAHERDLCPEKKGKAVRTKCQVEVDVSTEKDFSNAEKVTATCATHLT